MSAEGIVAAKYARALLQLADEQGLAEQLNRDLAQLAPIFGQDEGRAMLAHPFLPKNEKLRLVKEALGPEAPVLIVELFRLLIDKRRESLLMMIAANYTTEWLEMKKRRTAVVTSAIPLTAEQMDRLRRRLHALIQREVEMVQRIDASIQAGARVEIGDTVMDGTLTGRLQRLRRTLRVEN